ncbi:hypothetical protein AX17_003737 [Amanita inopinata Kibby_2008]|nr:hypothetical protein AX17_003737 [Amanita inopinata Kibby_2008]
MPSTRLTPEHRELLTSSIAYPLPFCSGTFPVSPADLAIYYGKEKDACRIDLHNVSTDCLKRLADACDPATFGVDHEDVYDESYRKAGKLGSDAFRPAFDPANLGLADSVRDRLLRGLQAQKPIRAELYNMNVYGKGSFFKAHRDTPRGERMFGSLVVFYPTPHEGGALIMRKDGKEWMFESAKELAEHNEPRIGYVALYSDVEHEVALVTSGYRVTVTYNLYFADPIPAVDVPLSANALAFKTAFEKLLDDPKFLPNGGNLGFGLEYQYPLPTAVKSVARLDDVEKCLKGSDAEIRQVAKALSLGVSLWALIREGEFEDEFTVACKGVAPDYSGIYFDEHEALSDWLSRKFHGKDLHVDWITKPSSLNREKKFFMAYGNEAYADHAYTTICMIVRIGRLSERTTLEDSSASDTDCDSSSGSSSTSL